MAHQPSELRDVGEVLVACLLTDGEPLADEQLRVNEQQWHKLPEAARYHGVSGATHLALRYSRLVPEPVACALADAHHAMLEWHLLSWQVLAETADRFTAAGIDYVAVKGPVLAETVYARPDLRTYADVDLFVRPASFPHALAELEATGGELIEQNWELVLHELKGELNVVTPWRVVIDLHWSLLYDADLRRSFRWSDVGLIDRATPRSISGRCISTPNAADQLLHLCVHACLAGCHRLCWLQDIRLAATREPIDWDDFWRAADQAGLGLVATVALERTNRCLGTDLPIPRGIGANGRSWRALVRGLDRLRPPARWWGGALSGHLLVQGTRAGTGASVRAAGGRVRTGLRDLLHEPEHPWRHGPVIAHEHPMRVDSGGPRGRAAFLAAVAAGRSPLGG